MPRDFRPPAPEGEPYRADPADPFPFPTEADAPPRQEPPTDLPEVPRWSHPPTHNPNYAGTAPMPGEPTGGAAKPKFRQPGGAIAGSASPPAPVARQARIGLWIGVASLFVFNVFLGPAAIVLGIRAIRNGEKQLGQWAVGLGTAGLLIGITVMVLIGTGVMPSVEEMLRDIRDGR